MLGPAAILPFPTALVGSHRDGEYSDNCTWRRHSCPLSIHSHRLDQSRFPQPSSPSFSPSLLMRSQRGTVQHSGVPPTQAPRCVRTANTTGSAATIRAVGQIKLYPHLAQSSTSRSVCGPYAQPNFNRLSFATDTKVTHPKLAWVHTAVKSVASLYE